jgi:hypothetical protein
LATALGAGLTAFLDVVERDGRDGFPDRTGRRAAWARFFAGLRPEVTRAFTARRNFAMPEG